VWLDPRDAPGVGRTVSATPTLRWVQLPFAGVENVFEAGVIDPALTWTCAKGSYAAPVAEHALLLALAGLRGLPGRIVAREWGTPAGITLVENRVTILGGGGIAGELIGMLTPLRTEITVVRRNPEPVPGAARTLATADLHQALAGAAVVFLALALSPATTGIIGARELELMDEEAWLVNVARGRHVVTDDLVDALRSGTIAGAALDVTDPEPLPTGHPLWDLDNCIITPHTADTYEMIVPLLAERIRTNVGRFGRGETLVGLVDPVAGY